MQTIRTTRAQKKFLRALATHPHGPPQELWPSPAILRRWLRKQAFGLAMLEIRDTLRFHSDLQLAFAAAHAASALAHASTTPAPQNLSQQALADLHKRIDTLISLLKLSHVRQRFEVASERASRHARFRFSAEAESAFRDLARTRRKKNERQ